MIGRAHTFEIFNGHVMHGNKVLSLEWKSVMVDYYDQDYLVTQFRLKIMMKRCNSVLRKRSDNVRSSLTHIIAPLFLSEYMSSANSVPEENKMESNN